MTSFPSKPLPTCSRLGPRNADRAGATKSRADLVIADKGSPSPTTQTTPGIDDRLVKREVEDKTEYKDRQIDGWKNQLAVFSLKFFYFLKKTLFTGKNSK
jgi:hypothetical protein